MAERRMFAKTIIDSDAFLDMPMSAQALYFHLAMRADDDGFLNNPRRIQRTVGASDDDLKLLLMKNFILAFETGVIVIKHWRIHNYIQKDRYKPTVYQEEKAELSVKENGAYTRMDTGCIQTASSLEAQVRLGKSKERLVKDRLLEAGEPPKKNTTFKTPSLEEVKAYCDERRNGVDPQRFVDYYTANGWMVGRNRMKDWKAAVRTWEKNSPKPTGKVQTRKKPDISDLLDMLDRSVPK